MSWIEKKGDWLGKGRKDQRSEVRGQRSDEKKVLTVAEAAYELGVDKQTVYKYMAMEAGEEAPIPFDAWYRLPGGHIRIYRYIIVEIKQM